MSVTTEMVGGRQVETHRVDVEPVRVRILPDDSMDMERASCYHHRQPDSHLGNLGSKLCGMRRKK